MKYDIYPPQRRKRRVVVNYEQVISLNGQPPNVAHTATNKRKKNNASAEPGCPMRFCVIMLALVALIIATLS